MRFVKTMGVLPMVVTEETTKSLVVVDEKPTPLKFITTIPSKVPGTERLVDPKDLGNNVDTYV